MTCSSASRDAIGISAASGDGVEGLLDAIEGRAFAKTLEPMELLIPYDHGSVELSELHALAGQVDREDRPGTGSSCGRASRAARPTDSRPTRRAASGDATAA